LPSKAGAGRSSSAGSGAGSGVPPEQLLAPTQGCTLRQRVCNLSNAMSKKYVCYDMQDLVTILRSEEELRYFDNLGFSWL
jgi:hypothetical protein